MKIKIGTRKSQLAMWQAQWVAERLEQTSLQPEIIPIDTRGDKILDVSISKIGSKGVFTEELERMLENGDIDIAVHSAKDLQSRLDDGFDLIAFSPREEVNDVIVADVPIDLHSPDTILATSSTRRVAFMRHFYPNVNIVDVRGNLQTRIRKMHEGLAHGLVLAAAGVKRMGYDDRIKEQLAIEEFTPAVGQGCIAVEAHQRQPSAMREQVRTAVNDVLTESCVLAERSYLATMNGGCSIPIFGLASRHGDQIRLKAGIIGLNGEKLIIEHAEGPDPLEVGQRLGAHVLSTGGEALLREIRLKIDG